MASTRATHSVPSHAPGERRIYRGAPMMPPIPRRPGVDLAGPLRRQVIGYLGLVLPIATRLMAGWRPTPGLSRWHLLGSISAYFYTGAVIVFVGVLAALSVYLLTYRGYRNASGPADRFTAWIAGLAAALVALFPTAAPAPLAAAPWWGPWIEVTHQCAAVTLFACFIVFSLFLFTQSSTPKPPRDKQVRNGVYIGCGLGMIAFVTWAVVRGHRQESIFWQEAGALWLFAFSWLTKGRADETARRVVSRAVHYGRHPSHVARDVRQGIRAMQGEDAATAS